MHASDKIVARLAVERGWVDAKTLQDVIRELENADGAKPSLASALRSRGIVDDAQHRVLTSEQSRQERLVERFSDIRRADSVFGQMLVQRGTVPNASVEEGLYVQGAERLRGRVRRLADILVERGILDHAALVEALRGMAITHLTCAGCASKFPIETLMPSDPLTCGSCGSPLVDETTFTLLRRERPPTPEEVAIAEQIPEREYGKFVLVQHVGSGGMGAVWKAWDRDLGRWVAVKMLRSVQDPDKRDEDVRRFLREASVVARLRHPNIVSVYESGEIKSQQVIVMEFIEGKPLNHMRLAPRLAMEVIRDAARAVQYAHEQGVVHRDLKPGNVMRTDKGQVYVMDFGLARSLSGASTLTQTGFVIGTPMYMPPEQAQAIPGRDEKLCDVYSLGATLYDCLTGRSPFEAEQPWDVIADVIHSEPVPPSRRNPEVPRDAETITLKAMSKRAEARYASAGALADDIDRFLKGETILARPTPVVERTIRWVKRRAWAAGAVTATVLAVIVATAVVVSLRARDARRRAHEAESHVEAARAGLSQYRELRAERAALAKRMGELAETSGEWAKAEARVKEVDAALASRFEGCMKECGAAEALVPAHEGARRVAGDVLWERFLLAEEREEADVGTAASMVRAYAGDRYGAALEAEGTLSLATEPPGASVEYRPYVEGQDGRLVPGEAKVYGVTPLNRVSVPRGSGVLVLRKADLAETRVPVLVRRARELALKVRMFAASEIPPGFVHVPAGMFVAGDPEALRGQRRREVHVEDFFIAKHEVTYREYLEFLNDLDDERSQEHVPRSLDGRPRIPRQGGRWTVPEDKLDWPLSYVRWADAAAYAEWKSARGGKAYRLPSALEWEKAARGVDGRAWPWGNRFDWSLTWGAKSAPDAANRLRAVGEIEGDESPYGVRDMAGNVSEWCADAWEGAVVSHEARGGAFTSDAPIYLRCGSRQRQSEVQQPQTGFRLAATPKR